MELVLELTSPIEISEDMSFSEKTLDEPKNYRFEMTEENIMEAENIKHECGYFVTEAAFTNGVENINFTIDGVPMIPVINDQFEMVDIIPC